jgi:uncharacterized membrane protein YdjX (TVP38/TMEM64 family)
MRQALIVFIVGVAIAIAPWVPLEIISALHPKAMLFGLGLLTLVVSAIGGVIALVGFVRFLVPASRAIRKLIEKRDAQFC